jgi:hypothetical protein
MKFLQEIIESRMIRQLSQAQQFDLEQLTERLFEHLLALQVLSLVDERSAKNYVSGIINNLNFDGFRNTQKDLYNLLTLVYNSDRYNDIIKPNISISLPIFHIRRNLRAIANGKIDVTDYNNMMMILQRQYHRVGPRQANLRREISDWPRQTRSQRAEIIAQLLMLMRERMLNSDLYHILSGISKSQL